jgi:CTP synthase (UTP-ammonia lyase)
MTDALRIGIIGDYDGRRYHRATNEALAHAAATRGCAVELQWLPTPSLLEADADASLAACDALWCSPGSPYQSEAGALAAIRFARERGRPFIGT